MEIIASYVRDNNLGDRMSVPSLYFDFGCRVIPVDVRKIFFSLHQKHLIIGGGGLLNHLSRKIFLASLRPMKGKKIVWGIGQNSFKKEYIYPSFLKRFDLVGIRDYHVSYRWVPCVSCMHGSFDRQYTQLHDVVVYEHCRYPLHLKGVKVMNNAHSDMDAVIRFLGSAKTIITNSYHGAYWGQLLGKQVITIPWSSKFFTFRYPTDVGRITSRSSYKSLPIEITKKGKSIPSDYLDICRDANRSFYKDVIQSLHE